MMDFQLTKDGDLTLSSSHTLKIVKNDELKLQIARCCVQSVQSDWYIDNIGANLEQYLGMPFSESLIEAIKLQISTSLVEQTPYKLDEIYIETLASTKHDVTFRVYLKTSENAANCFDLTIDGINGAHIKKG